MAVSRPIGLRSSTSPGYQAEPGTLASLMFFFFNISTLSLHPGRPEHSKQSTIRANLTIV